MSYQLKEWRTLRTSPMHKVQLMFDRAEEMHLDGGHRASLVYLTKIWNAIDGGFFPLSGGGERDDYDYRNSGTDYGNNLQDDLWWSMVERCPWAFFHSEDGTTSPNNMNFTYRDN